MDLSYILLNTIGSHLLEMALLPSTRPVPKSISNKDLLESREVLELNNLAFLEMPRTEKGGLHFCPHPLL